MGSMGKSENSLSCFVCLLKKDRFSGAFIDWITSDEPYLQQPMTDTRNRVFEVGKSKLSIDREASLSSNSDVQADGSIANVQQQQLPDLVCDIDNNTAAVEMTDSMRTATQSTGLTDDEMLPVDEYVDAASDVGASTNAKWGMANGTGGGSAIDPPWLVETRGGKSVGPFGIGGFHRQVVLGAGEDKMTNLVIFSPTERRLRSSRTVPRQHLSSCGWLSSEVGASVGDAAATKRHRHSECVHEGKHPFGIRDIFEA